MLELTKLIIDYYEGKNLSIEEIADQLDKSKVEVIENFLDNKLYVKKKSGKIELFNIEKIARSILNAARNTETMINTSDINIIKKDLEEKISENYHRIIPTSTIKEYVEDILLNDGYKRIYESYKNYID